MIEISCKEFIYFFVTEWRVYRKLNWLKVCNQEVDKTTL